MRPEGTSGPIAAVGAGADGTVGCDDAAGVDSIDDGAVGETAVNPPHAVASSDSVTATNLGSFMDALHCRFRSGGNPPLQRPGWQVMTS